ncbi:histidine ammonia-lyase [Starkeya sp. ORNL1]|uniref:histidine ammonia-lyase n=1 Tax=Starkeya sp. ORNL1 TaxID=2709380 RepID=UPI0014649D49|nr:histidine ammonia-lyase [Starkeya sp. ORNL1]QJP12336.1 histidine ammonia-lyase [Starkeya sp. ORNL1]
MSDLTIEPGALRLADLRAFADDGHVQLSVAARQRIAASNRQLHRLIGEGATIYGVNTGFGPLSGQRIDDGALGELQRRVVLSNAAGTGAPLAIGIVRRAMALKLATFAIGASGISEALADALVFFLNAGITPVVPEKGSVGASGDLAPLAHIAAALIGEGDVFHRGVRKPAAAAVQAEGAEPLALQPKEGLALVNGTQVSTALAVEGLFGLEDLFRTMLPIAALSVEAGSGTAAAFDPRIHALRNQDGQVHVAARLRDLLASSALQADRPVKRVQDPYCLRCLPQVMGAVHDQMTSAAGTLAREINGVSDNPLIDPASGDVLYGGNFHAQPIGLAADGLALAYAEMGSMSERRTAFLVDPAMSGLPAFLVAQGGLNSGFMVAQVTAAALASENKFLASPASIDSIPTAANLEDYVSMATHAARRLGDMAANLRAILAIELLAAAQGLDLRRPARSSPAIEDVHAHLRTGVAAWTVDRFFAPDLDMAVQMVRTGLPHAEFALPSSP